jgi:hypothetical protein
MGLFGPDSVPPNQLQVEKAKGIVAYQMENDNICRKPLIVQFETLCANPMAEIAKILDFCSITYDENSLNNLSKLVVTPITIGRHQTYQTDVFDPEDIYFIQEKWVSALHQ